MWPCTALRPGACRLGVAAAGRAAAVPMRSAGASIRFAPRGVATAAAARRRLPLLGGAARVAPAPPLLPQLRRATTVFSVKGRDGTGEQTLFVVGLNKGRFFGNDSAEEALKLLERISEHGGAKYRLLFGLTERELQEIEEYHAVKNNRLTPSRDLEKERHCEFIPVAQAGMVDEVQRIALGRLLKTTQTHVAYLLWKYPRETVQLYWAYWRRKDYKDAACREFWTKYFPKSSYGYFGAISELIALRTVEQLASAHMEGKSRTYVLVLSNMFYQPVTERLTATLDETAPEKLASTEFLQHQRDRAGELTLDDVPDFTPILVFVYLGIPILICQFFYLFADSMLEKSGMYDQLFSKTAKQRE